MKAVSPVGRPSASGGSPAQTYRVWSSAVSKRKTPSLPVTNLTASPAEQAATAAADELAMPWAGCPTRAPMATATTANSTTNRLLKDRDDEYMARSFADRDVVRMVQRRQRGCRNRRRRHKPPSAMDRRRGETRRA